MTPQDQIARHINDFGFSVMGVFGGQGSPPFAYTVGLTETYNHPELLVVGMGQKTAAILFNAIAAKLKSPGGLIIDGDIMTDIANLPIAFKKISRGMASHYAFQCLYWYAGKKVQPEFMQMVMSDRSGNLPWSEDYDIAYMGPKQPELWHNRKF